MVFCFQLLSPTSEGFAVLSYKVDTENASQVAIEGAETLNHMVQKFQRVRSICAYIIVKVRDVPVLYSSRAIVETLRWAPIGFNYIIKGGINQKISPSSYVDIQCTLTILWKVRVQLWLFSVTSEDWYVEGSLRSLINSWILLVLWNVTAISSSSSNKYDSNQKNGWPFVHEGFSGCILPVSIFQ